VIRFLRRFLGRLARAFGRAFGILFFLAMAWLAGLAWFTHDIDLPTDDPVSTTDAIVVLTGGSQRIDVGFRLLVDGKAKKLFVSGVHEGVDMPEVLKTSPQTPHWVECCVVLGHSADNTVGNALETAAWLQSEHFHSPQPAGVRPRAAAGRDGHPAPGVSRGGPTGPLLVFACGCRCDRHRIC